ncbi:MAG: SDR family NAD(P)-dependent oxidoreductase, partial [Gordonibacter urolithinfaciens]
MYPDLNGKTAVVTGASVGLGHGIARRFLQEGVSVVVNFHSDKHRGEAQKLADEFNASGETARVVLVQADISQEDGALKLREAALEHFGGIDVWVNNAGIESRHPTHELPLDVWEKTLAVNMTGVFLGSKAALEHFVEQDRKGCIVNLSSVHERIPWPTFAH